MATTRSSEVSEFQGAKARYWGPEGVATVARGPNTAEPVLGAHMTREDDDEAHTRSSVPDASRSAPSAAITVCPSRGNTTSSHTGASVPLISLLRKSVVAWPRMSGRPLPSKSPTNGNWRPADDVTTSFPPNVTGAPGEAPVIWRYHTIWAEVV